MKYILFIFIIAFTDYVFGQGDAPPLLQGQYQGSKSVGSFIQTPNAGVTKINSSTALIETGNNNILVNPSFEHQVFSTGWTVGSGTFTEETVNEIHGKKAAKLVLSSQTMSLTQSSTLYQAQFADGVQGLASVRVKSDVALRVCSRSAGVTSSSLCVDVQANNKWGLYKVPFILGATSNGISIASTGNVTGTVYVDDAFVGAASLTQNMNACNDTSCETEFSAKISGASVVSDENLDWITSCSSGGTGFKVCTFKTGLFTVAPNCQMVSGVASTSNFLTRISASSATSATFLTMNTNATPADGPFEILCQKQGADFTAAKQLSNGNTYSSTNADTDWASCGHTPASFTGFGSPTAIETQCKRQGGDLLMKGKFTAGVVTAVEARLSLPLWNGSQLVSAGTSLIPTIQLAGDHVRNQQGATYFRGTILSEPSVSYITFGAQSSTQNGLTKTPGTNLANNSDIISYTARIPIEGWQNSNIIIGQFNGLESCSSTLDCTDTFSAYITSAATVVSGSENVDFLDGNCTLSLTSNYSCNFKAGVFTSAPNCVVSPAAAGSAFGGRTAAMKTISTTQLSYITEISSSLTPMDVQIICQKSGPQYLGKTAKAVASDQNLRSPGITNSVLCSAKISNTGVITDQQGGCFASCTNVTTPVCTFTTDYWASIPNCWVNSTGGGLNGEVNVSLTTMSGIIYSSAINAFNAPRNYVCHGVKK